MNDHNNFFFGRLFPIAASVSLALLNGCAVMHPMREPVDLKKLPVVLDSATDLSCNYAGCMEHAVEYADQWRRHYYDEAASLQLWRNAMLAPLLPISAISLYRSTQFENEKKLIGGYAATGGAMFGITRYFGLPIQQTTYLTASHALSCTMLNARNSLIPRAEFATLNTQISQFTAKLPEMQLAYGNLLVAASQVQDEEVAKAAKVQILNPLGKRIAFMERLHARAIALRNDNRTSGEALRRKVDLITAETAIQLTADIPTPDKILALIGDFQGTADKIGIGAFPAPAEAPTATTPPASTTSTSGELAKNIAAEVKATTPFLVDSADHQALKKFVGSVGEEMSLQVFSVPDYQLKSFAAEATKEIKDAKKRIVLQQEFVASAIKEFAKGGLTQQGLPVKPKSAPIAKSKSATPNATSAGGAVGTVFDQLLVALKIAKTIELHATSGNVLDFKGTFTRPATVEETDAAKQKEKAADKHLSAINNEVAKFAASTDGKAAYDAMRKIRIPAETVYHNLRGILATKATVLKDCKPDAEKDLPPFTISPQVTEVTLTKDKPAEFIVSNNKQIPKVAIGGKNTDKIKHDVKLKGDDFVVVVTATDAIPDGEEAVMAITDFTGKRKIEVKIDANASK